MKDFWNKSWPYLVALLVGFGIGILINLPSCNKLESKIEYIPVHDTLTIEKERIVEHTQIKYVKDTLLRVDSVYLQGDTTYVYLPVEFKLYKDTLKTDSTSAVIQIDHHGIASEIDSIKLDYQYFKEREIIVKEPKRIGWTWQIGPSIGYGGFVDIPHQNFSHGPFVGISFGIGFGGFIKK